MTARQVELQVVQNSAVGTVIDIPSSLGLLEQPEDKPLQYHGVMRIMTPKDGDKRVTWDSRDFIQIREAKDMFDKCVAEGLVPYRVGIGGKATPEVMAEFDPFAEEILFLPIRQVVGG